MKGLVHIYKGFGKGKTTAAIGLGIRAYGSGLKVLMVQFLKSMDSGEVHVLKDLHPNFQIMRSNETMKFTWAMDKDELHSASNIQRELLDHAIEQCKNTEIDVLILDEILGVIESDLLEVDVLVSFLKDKPEGLEVILTGRNAPKELLDIADYVSDIGAVKHPYELGIKQRKGIEY